MEVMGACAKEVPVTYPLSEETQQTGPLAVASVAPICPLLPPEPASQRAS